MALSIMKSAPNVARENIHKRFMVFFLGLTPSSKESNFYRWSFDCGIYSEVELPLRKSLWGLCEAKFIPLVPRQPMSTTRTSLTSGARKLTGLNLKYQFNTNLNTETSPPSRYPKPQMPVLISKQSRPRPARPFAHLPKLLQTILFRHRLPAKRVV